MYQMATDVRMVGMPEFFGFSKPGPPQDRHAQGAGAFPVRRGQSAKEMDFRRWPPRALRQPPGRLGVVLTLEGHSHACCPLPRCTYTPVLLQADFCELDLTIP